jgi:hypothetical protein
MAEKESAPKQLRTCPYCDAEIAEAQFPYCEACGLKAVPCPGCGLPVAATRKTCPHCGCEIMGY